MAVLAPVLVEAEAEALERRAGGSVIPAAEQEQEQEQELVRPDATLRATFLATKPGKAGRPLPLPAGIGKGRDPRAGNSASGIRMPPVMVETSASSEAQDLTLCWDVEVSPAG